MNLTKNEQMVLDAIIKLEQSTWHEVEIELEEFLTKRETGKAIEQLKDKGLIVLDFPGTFMQPYQYIRKDGEIKIWHPGIYRIKTKEKREGQCMKRG